MIRSMTLPLLICGVSVAVLVPHGSVGNVLPVNEGKPDCLEFVRVVLEGQAPLSQGDTQGCGPVSLLNLLKLGPEPYRKAFAKICEGDDKRALELLAQKHCSPSGSGVKAV